MSNYPEGQASVRAAMANKLGNLTTHAHRSRRASQQSTAV